MLVDVAFDGVEGWNLNPIQVLSGNGIQRDGAPVKSLDRRAESHCENAEKRKRRIGSERAFGEEILVLR